MRAILLILAMLCFPLRLSAQPVSDGVNKAAEGHHETGTRFFTEGRYDLARIEFEAAYALTKEPDLLYNIAICYEREGDLKQVITYLERYLAQKPDDEKTKAKLQKMREQLAPPSPSPPPPKASPEVSRMSTKRKAGIALISVGAASLVAALATGISTQLDRDALMSGELTFGQAMTTAERAQATRGASIALGVVGGAFLVGGIPLVVVR